MFEIPLFPLNTVMFPDMPMPLHIFEDRYKLMIKTCIEEKRPFGIVLIREGTAENGPLATPHDIGCTVEITQVQTMEDGRMLIMVIGQERFRILSLKRDKPYLVGVVESVSLEMENEQMLARMSGRLRPLVIDYLQILSKVGQIEFDPVPVPTEPQALGYLAAAVIQLPTEQKQSFLTTDSPTTLLRQLHHSFQQEVALMQHMPKANQGLFSLN
jgi:Lon protease-like protein